MKCEQVVTIHTSKKGKIYKRRKAVRVKVQPLPSD